MGAQRQLLAGLLRKTEPITSDLVLCLLTSQASLVEWQTHIVLDPLELI